MHQLRRYTPQDYQQIMQLFQLNTPTYFYPDEQADLHHFLTEEPDSEYYFILEKDGRIAASAGYVVKDGTGILTWFIVDSSQHRQGLGSRLLTHHIEALRQSGIRHIRLRTSQLVYSFYERFGFVVTHTEDDYWGPGMHLYQMELSLPSDQS